MADKETEKGRRILVADDDEGISRLLTRILQRAGYTVVTAVDGAQAVSQAQQESPDLVLLDILMPGGGGLLALARLKMSAKTDRIPVIVLTGAASAEEEARALATGAIRSCGSRLTPPPCWMRSGRQSARNNFRFWTRDGLRAFSPQSPSNADGLRRVIRSGPGRPR